MRDSTTPFMWLAFGTLNCHSKCVRSAASSRLRRETSHESIASRSGRCAPWKFLPRSLRTVVGCTPRRETNRRHASRNDSVDALLVSSRWTTRVVVHVTIITDDSIVTFLLTFVCSGPKKSTATAANGGVQGFPRMAGKMPICCCSIDSRLVRQYRHLLATDFSSSFPLPMWTPSLAMFASTTRYPWCR